MRAEVKAYRPFLRPGAIVFDVGANLGEWSFMVSSYLQGRAKLFMFEPQPACRRFLAPLIERGAILTQAAVGEVEGEATFFTPDPNGAGGNASLHMRRDTDFSKTGFVTEKVQVITIDQFMERQEIDRVDFLKMNIEGNELAALRGADKALQRKAIRALSFEFGSGNINSRTFFHDFWDLLTGYGYKISRVLPGGRLLQIDCYHEELEYFRGVSNYVADADRVIE
jgi:FkbM family methyltransferase